MATLIETRDGKLIYDNGLERDAVTGRIVKPAAGSIITAEKSRELHRERQQKAAALLRDRIRETHNKTMEPVKSSAGAFAESGALLYEEIVLNAEAYPRDRMEAWEKLGKYAGVLSDPRDGGNGTEPTANQQAAAIGAAAALQFISDVIAAKATIQPADVIDTRKENDVVDGTTNA